jgi:hypothetical protein
MITRRLMSARWFKTVCIEQVRCVGQNIEKRFLPAFDSITEEANKVEEDAWVRFEESAGPDADPASGAEWAFREGLSHYMNLEDLQQGFINFSAAYCYHFFEQQLFYFHKKELLERRKDRIADYTSMTKLEAVSKDMV